MKEAEKITRPFDLNQNPLNSIWGGDESVQEIGW